MSDWRQRLFKTEFGIIESNDDRLNTAKKKKECGFAACAVGWLPSFFPKQFSTNNLFGTKSGVDLTDFFGITGYEFDQIAYPANYEMHESKITPKDVAKRIKEVIEGKRECECACGVGR
jgi:hypothetical protein